MSVQVSRPDTSNLVLCVFSRPLHPDLFLHEQSSALRNDEFTLEAKLCTTGHLLTLKYRSDVVSEVISDCQEPLPSTCRLFESRFRGSRSQTILLKSGLRYSVCSSLEFLDPSTYLRQHEELLSDRFRAILCKSYHNSNRFSPGPVSLIRADLMRSSLFIHAFHTFPDQLAVLKTQTLFEID
ncbi:MAG: DUF2617 family protein [Planctomycetes bacterium]|nr:DUF2617 family protein [Planctomycetota bacterium]